MKARSIALNGPEDCFARFDEAFAQLEADLATLEPHDETPTATAADLSEYADALDNIDRQLAVHPTGERPAAAGHTGERATASAVVGTSVDASRSDSRAALALVPPSTSLSETARTPALAPHEVEAFWERPAAGSAPLERLVGAIQNLLWLQRAIHARSARTADRVRWEQVAAVFREVRQLCAEFDLHTACVRAEFALEALDEDRLDLLSVEIAELVRHIRHDLQACSIVPIPRDRVWGFTLALDARTQDAFPSATGDTAEAGRCMAFGLHSAAAFHLLRAAEQGRRAAARAVRLDERAPEAGEWCGTTDALQIRIRELSRWPAGPARKAAKDYLTRLSSDARQLKEAQRRAADGERFEECHAVALWYATRDFKYPFMAEE